MKNKFLISTILAGALLACTAGGMYASASSHREAPNITTIPAVDGTDFYMFNSYESGRSDYVTIIANYLPLQDPFGGPNYFALDPAAIYEIHIDNNGDAKEDLTFQFKFNNTLTGGNGIALNVGGKQVAVPLKTVGQITAGNTNPATTANLNFGETYSVNLIRGNRYSGTRSALTAAAGGGSVFAKPLDNIGTKTLPDYNSYANQFIYNVNIPGCSAGGKLFVGQRREGFAVNLGKAFDLVNIIPVDAASGFPGGISQSAANNTVGNKNITTLALEVPKTCLKGSGNGVMGGWTTASLPQARLLNPNPAFGKATINGGAYVQVSRLSMPLVNELVIGLKDKDNFNASLPQNDAQFLTYVTNPSFPAILNILFKDAVNTTLGTSIADLAPTNFPRNDLVAIFLTGVKGVNQLATVTPSEMLRLNTEIAATPKGSQSTFGVVGNDLAGYPNGRRPGDDVVDITLRAAMGALCHPIPVAGTPTNLGFCNTSDAATGTVAFTDGAPVSDADFLGNLPYLNTPVAGSSF